MKSQIDSLPDLINEDQNLYGLCFNDNPDLYKEMINLTYPQIKPYSSKNKIISNTEILFGPSSQVSPNELNLEPNKKSCPSSRRPAPARRAGRRTKARRRAAPRRAAP